MSPSLRWPKGSLFRWDSTSPSSRKQHAMPKFFSNNHQSKWAKVALPGVCIIIFYIRLGIFCASTLPMAWFSALLCDLLRPQHQDFSGFSCVFFDWVMILWKFQRSCHELNNYWYIYIYPFFWCVCVRVWFFLHFHFLMILQLGPYVAIRPFQGIRGPTFPQGKVPDQQVPPAFGFGVDRFTTLRCPNGCHGESQKIPWLVLTALNLGTFWSLVLDAPFHAVANPLPWRDSFCDLLWLYVVKSSNRQENGMGLKNNTR